MAFMEKNYPVDWTYADFASQFHAEFYGEWPLEFIDRFTHVVF
jgi:hypothetical protein